MSFAINWLVDGPNKSYVDQSNGRIISEYKRTYLYRTDSSTPPTDAQIATDLGIYPGSPHPDDVNASCKSVQISHGVGPTKCPHFARHIEVEWATNALNPNQTSTDPTLTRTIWSVKPTIQSRYIVKDRLGNMILNAAGQPFDGGIPVAVRMGVAIARKNRDATGYNQANVIANSGKLNSVAFLGAIPKTLQVDIESEEKYEGDYHYWAETYTFSYDPLGWQPKPVDAGFYQRAEPLVFNTDGTVDWTTSIANGAGDLRRILSSDVGDTTDNSPVQEPEPLLETGLVVPVSQRPSGCRFLTVDYFGTMDFASFNL